MRDAEAPHPAEPLVPAADDSVLPGARDEHAPAGAGAAAAPRHAARHRSAKPSRRRRSGCLPVLVVAVLFIVAVGWIGRGWVADVKDMLSGPEDYPGPGSGEVVLVIDPGQSVTSIGNELAELDVVASGEAFVDAAADNPKSTGIQAGSYVLKLKMKASDAVAYLIDPANVAVTQVTIPEGFTVDQIVARLEKATEFSAEEFRQVLEDPAAYDLPDYAQGNPEGYLFPATYAFTPADEPADMLAAMVARYERALGDNDIEKTGAALGPGYTPEQIMTVASLVEAEGRGDDMPKIARAIYNRLEKPNGGGTNGLLQIDAAVLYALGTRDTSKLRAPLADLTDSPYNTYRFPGLPPGPIGAPGEKAIQAALKPAEGDWIYWVTVDCQGTTKFSETLAEHNQYQAVNGDEC
ncbi:endolytic transglycosylase MltG [Nocardioides sp. zg-536]|uniref:Endolytic murein transglycosylase n=1 Tax=Nocardioides faecalis TaxID=2803858 RepID=A0A939BXG8_9ACTN|nr:endolytic transglycosylase MltG [Nocardioides faecalis]MBM9458815.1 endolytic transglycosylase MltG [Nocardioides faecalis]QVI60225.1 endolytic transglycosylase MltG [Nocardioides faecalis]